MPCSLRSETRNGHGHGIVRIYYILYIIYSKQCSVITSYCGLCGCSIAGGELFERIVDDNFEHTERASMHYVQQILEGVAFMHQQNILHLDLKPENIVCVDKTGTFVKIIDFGLASKIGRCNKPSNGGVTQVYHSKPCLASWWLLPAQLHSTLTNLSRKSLLERACTGTLWS